jgi:ABC-2 type transport system permease protein
MIAPLDVFPEAIRSALLWTPFPYLIYFPSNLLIDVPVPMIQGFSVTLLWIAGLWVLNRWLWRVGLKHYSGMGA